MRYDKDIGQIGRCRRQAGFSIVELLIALIIITILVALVVPVLNQRAAEARLRAAQTDLRLIAAAEQSASVDIGYFLRLYVLDDVTGGDGYYPQNPPDPLDIIDGLQDERFNTRNPDGHIYGIVPDYGTLPQGTGGGTTQNPGQLVNITYLMENETRFAIGLPYMTFQRQWSDPATGFEYNVPMDPWGNPYLVFTRVGMINDTIYTGTPAPAGTVGGASNALLETVLINGRTYDAVRFDRLTILSLGPNGDVGSGAGPGVTNFGEDDDLLIKLN